jgi:hypothetical protein
MFPKFKVSKREEPDKGWYTLFNSRVVERPEWKSLEYYQIASIDPATNNFAMRIDRWWISGKNTGQIIPIVFEKVSFKAEDPVNCNLVYDRLTNFLTRFTFELKNCHYIISERQLMQNYKAVRISTHALAVISTLTVGYGIIIEVNPKLKGWRLGAPKGLTERQLKEWAVEKAAEILEERGDRWSLDILKKTKKKDDLSDTVVQAVALVNLLEIFDFSDKVLINQTPVPKLKINIINDPLENTQKSARLTIKPALVLHNKK